jgi:hypothetical protein
MRRTQGQPIGFRRHGWPCAALRQGGTIAFNAVTTLRGSTLPMEVTMLGTILVISGALAISLIGGLITNPGACGVPGARGYGVPGAGGLR